MTTTKLILTDIDGVLLNWDAGFARWMNAHGYFKPLGCVTNTYDLYETWQIPKQEMNTLIKVFNASISSSSLAPYGEAGHYVKRLSEKGYTFATCTSFGGTRESRRNRILNLETVFGEVFAEHNIIELGGNKEPVLAKWRGTEFWWIEDNIHNARIGLDLGLRPILLRNPHNVDYDDDDLVVAETWREIFTIITGEKEITNG